MSRSRAFWYFKCVLPPPQSGVHQQRHQSRRWEASSTFSSPYVDEVACRGDSLTDFLPVRRSLPSAWLVIAVSKERRSAPLRPSARRCALRRRVEFLPLLQANSVFPSHPVSFLFVGIFGSLLWGFLKVILLASVICVSVFIVWWGIRCQIHLNRWQEIMQKIKHIPVELRWIGFKKIMKEKGKNKSDPILWPSCLLTSFLRGSRKM